jgi:toxin YoeB
MDLVLDPHFLEDLEFWVATDRKTALRILKLMEEVRRNPFCGAGKPEPLKHLGAGIWSRRIIQEHRLVYQLDAGRVAFLQCRYHY